MKINGFKAAVVAGFAFAASQASAAELLTNGGFEAPTVPGSCCTTTPSDPLPGWTVVAGDVNVVAGTFASSNGNLAFQGLQHLDLIGQSGAGSLSQTFNTIAGATYTLSFAYSHNLYGGLPAASASFSVDGLAGSLTHTGGNTSNLNWLTYTGTFVATGSSATLNFTNTLGGQNDGFMLDAVSVTGAVPEPSTWALFILGFGVLGAALRRSRKANIAFA